MTITVRKGHGSYWTVECEANGIIIVVDCETLEQALRAARELQVPTY